MDAPIPLWRTGIHALAADHGCKANPKLQGELYTNSSGILKRITLFHQLKKL
jgi:hypothetical protein